MNRDEAENYISEEYPLLISYNDYLTGITWWGAANHGGGFPNNPEYNVRNATGGFFTVDRDDNNATVHKDTSEQLTKGAVGRFGFRKSRRRNSKRRSSKRRSRKRRSSKRKSRRRSVNRKSNHHKSKKRASKRRSFKRKSHRY